MPPRASSVGSPSGPSAAEKYEAAKFAADDRAEKQLSNDLKLITPLADSNWSTFLFQINQTVHRNSWAESVLNDKDSTGAALVIQSMALKDDIENYRLHKQISNAYQIITTKCEKHDISSSLAAVKIGDARGAWKIVNDYFVRSTPTGRAAATKAFFNSSQMSTDTTLLQWFKAVDDLAADLSTARGAPVSDEDKKTLLLEGLLPEFKSKKLMIEDKGNSFSLSETKSSLQDYAQVEGLMTLRKGASQRKTQTYAVEGFKKRKGNFQSKDVPNAKNFKSHKENLATQLCKKWVEGICPHGANCYRKHEGPGGSLIAPTTTANAKSTPLPVPSAPLMICQYCSTNGHAVRDCPQFLRSVKEESNEAMFTSTKAAYTFPVIEEELPDNERNEKSSVSLKLLYLTLTATLTTIFLFFGDVVTGVRRNLKSLVGWRAILFFIVLALITYSYADPIPRVRSSSYFNENDPSGTSKDLQWVADSGTNRFVTNDINDFMPGSVVHTQVNVAVGGGSTVSPCSGSVLIYGLDHNVTIQCDNVILLPKCARKLMPAHQFTKKGCVLEFSDVVTLRTGSGKPILSGPEIGGLFYFHAKTIHATDQLPAVNALQASSLFGLPSSHNADFPRRLLEAHWSYGHLNFGKLRKLLGLAKGDDPECPICTIAKQKQAALADETKKVRSSRPCHRMHMDIGFTAGSEFIFALYVDDYHRISYLDLLDSKSQSLEKWCELKRRLENEFMPWKFAIIFTDSEPLYFTPGWEQHCKDEGLEHEFSSRHKHGQNGVVERAMQTVGTTFRCMMITGNAPPRCIPAALQFANVIRNHSPTKANQGMTPLEKAQGCKLPINQRLPRSPLFCLVFAYVYETERVKHAPRGVPCVYLGYDPRNNTYLVMEWKSGREYYTADLQFHKTVFPFRANPDRTLPSLNIWDDIAPHTTELIGPEEKVEQAESLRLADQTNENLKNQQPPSVRQRLPSSQALRNIPDVDAAPDSSAVTMTHAHLQSYHVGVNPDDVANIFVVQGYGPDPETMEEAIQMNDADEWIMADLSEKKSWEERDVVEIVPRAMAISRGKRVFKDKRVFKKKFLPPDATHPEGRLEKYKIRLTIAAYTRMLIEGIDYADKHASTVRWTAVLLIIAIATKFDYDIILLDISTFFLYGECKEEMYMEIPKGWGKDGMDADSGHVFRLKKTVYGLPQASNAAQRELKGAFMSDGGFRSTSGDDCVYVPTTWGKSDDGVSTEGYSVCGTHVDDIVGAGDSSGLRKISGTLGRKFKMTEKWNPTCITGVVKVY